MVGLEVIQKDMAALLEQDKSLNAIEVNADSLDEALADAATQLDTRVVNLEYEVLEKGSDGFLGLAKKPWKLRIYQNAASLAKKKKTAAQDIFSNEDFDEEVKIVDQDGLYYIRHFGDEIMLKVLLPVGRGRNVDVKDIINDARRPDTVSIEEGKIKEYAKKGTDGKYESIGLYKHIKAGDAMLIIDVSKDEMEATLTATAPAMSGGEITADQIRRALETQGVVAGIEEDKIAEWVDNPVYGAPCEVAHKDFPQWTSPSSWPKMPAETMMLPRSLLMKLFPTVPEISMSPVALIS